MWLSPVERCVRVAEVPGSNPGTPMFGLRGGRLTPHDSSCPDPGDAPTSNARTREGSGHCCLERWQNGYCTRLESERPKGLGGSNPSRSAGKLSDCHEFRFFVFGKLRLKNTQVLVHELEKRALLLKRSGHLQTSTPHREGGSH